MEESRSMKIKSRMMKSMISRSRRMKSIMRISILEKRKSRS